MTVRFHLDEHVPRAIAAALRARGIDVTTTSDAGLGGADDDEHVAFGLANGRVVFTHDDDFLALQSRSVEHAGIAYCHQDARTIGEIVAGLVLIHACMTAEEMRGRVEFL
jgi:hypothetical protein